MLKFKIAEISEKSLIGIFEFDGEKIITGSFFNEDSIINSFYSKNKSIIENEMDIEKKHDENNHNSSINFLDEFKILQVLRDTKIIIVTEISEVVCLPYILKKFNFNEIRIISTESIIQISKYYLKEFYKSFNKLLLNFNEVFITKGAEYINGVEINICENKTFNGFPRNLLSDFQNLTYINEKDIDMLVEKMEKVNFQEKFNLNPALKILLLSSGYELGSSNIIFEYFDKKISVLKKSCNFKYRYPRELDTSSLLNSDVLINFPDNINYSSTSYESQLERLVTEIYKIVSKTDIRSNHYPTIFMPTELLFILDFVDIFRYKIPKEVKGIYISDSIKAVIEYSNISHQFINHTIHNKIYEFKLPFSFDELIKNNSFYYYSSYQDFIKNYLNISGDSSPIIYMVNKFSYVFGEAQAVYETFVNNSYSSDAFINLDNYKTKNYKENVLINTNSPITQVLNFKLDYRLTFEQFRFILIENIRPLKLFYCENENTNLDFVKFITGNISDKYSIQNSSYCLDTEVIVNFDDIKYEKIYLITKTEEDLTSYVDQNCKISVEQENDNLLVRFTESQGDKPNDMNLLELFENDLNQLILPNNMKINEFLSKENSIKITIVKNNDECKEKDSYSDIEINLLENEFSILTENQDDSNYLNIIFQSIF